MANDYYTRQGVYEGGEAYEPKLTPGNMMDVMADNMQAVVHKLPIEMAMAQAMIDEKFIVDNWKVEELMNEYSRHLVYRLKAWFVTQDLETVKVPATWWDHFKLTFFGEYIEETIGFFGFRNAKIKPALKLKACYPNFPIEDLGKPYLKVVKIEESI